MLSKLATVVLYFAKTGKHLVNIKIRSVHAGISIIKMIAFLNQSCFESIITPHFSR